MHTNGAYKNWYYLYLHTSNILVNQIMHVGCFLTMFKSTTKRILDLLLSPFTEHFLFLIAFFVFATSPYICWQIISIHFYVNGIILFIHCVVLSYCVTLVIALIKPTIVQKIIKTFLLCASAIIYALNFYCVFKLGYLFDYDFALLIIDTTFKESKEFFSTLVPIWIIISISLTYIIFIVLFFFSKHYNLNLKKKSSLVAMGLMLLCMIQNARSWGIWKNGPIMSLIEIHQLDIPDDLKSYYTHPIISFNGNNESPITLVLIIGESFAKCHSSLYGYDKDTNPHLSNYSDSSSLFTFFDVTSPESTTAQSIKYMMSTYCKLDTANKNKKWYEYPSLIELMQECGFDCYWFSNQARGNKNNSTARIYAEACDSQWFLQQGGSDRGIDSDRNNLDIILVDSSSTFIQSLNPMKQHFIIYHMMGSHFDYSKRYPKEFTVFSESDYSEQPANQRTILANYDNSILYNDYVVAQIIGLFRNRESVVIYLPDHGQVMFRDPKNPSYYVHGNNNDPVSYALGIEIPFIIYASPLFQQNHPDTMRRIKSRHNNPKAWDSDDLPYLILDLIGVKKVNGEDVKDKSILD